MKHPLNFLFEICDGVEELNYSMNIFLNYLDDICWFLDENPSFELLDYQELNDIISYYCSGPEDLKQISWI